MLYCFCLVLQVLFIVIGGLLLLLGISSRIEAITSGSLLCCGPLFSSLEGCEGGIFLLGFIGCWDLSIETAVFGHL